MKRNTLLLVDDDMPLQTTLCEQLAHYEEFTVLTSNSGAAALEAIKQPTIDMVLLDVGLQDMDGREVCKLMRKGGFTGPILMLTGHVSDADTILGLESGANDYITKPFKFAVLLARIRTHLRTYENQDDAVLNIGDYQFKPAQRQLTPPQGKPVKLTDKEAGILKYMLKNAARPVNKDELLRDVWGYHTDVTTHTLETHIYRLRQKIDPNGTLPPLVMTVEGGYQLRT